MCIRDSQKPTQRAPEGKRFQKEAPLFWSKVMPVDPATGKPVRKVKAASAAEAPKAEEKPAKKASKKK